MFSSVGVHALSVKLHVRDHYSHFTSNSHFCSSKVLRENLISGLIISDDFTLFPYMDWTCAIILCQLYYLPITCLILSASLPARLRLCVCVYIIIVFWQQITENNFFICIDFSCMYYLFS